MAVMVPSLTPLRGAPASILLCLISVIIGHDKGNAGRVVSGYYRGLQGIALPRGKEPHKDRPSVEVVLAIWELYSQSRMDRRRQCSGRKLR